MSNSKEAKGVKRKRTAVSDIEIADNERLLRAYVEEKYGDFLKAFSLLDTKRNSSVRVKDFRKIIGTLFGQMPDIVFETILSKINKNPDGTVNYRDFLSRFSSKHPPVAVKHKNVTKRFRISSAKLPDKMTMKEIRSIIKEKISQDVRAVVKAFHFYDYDRDGKIPWNNFRKILDKFCCRLTDQQYDKLCQSETSFHSGMIDYNCFLQQLGIKADSSNSCSGSIDGCKATKTEHFESGVPKSTEDWDPKSGLIKCPADSWQPYYKHYQLSPPTRSELLNHLEKELRITIKKNYLKIREALMTIDTNLEGYISMADFKEVVESVTSPMSDLLFCQLMERFGIRSKDKIAWQIFLDEFTSRKEMISVPKSVEFINHPRLVIPMKGTNSDINVTSIFHHFKENLLHCYGSLENAFTNLDTRQRGWLTRTDIRILLKRLYDNLNDKEFHEVLFKLDPDHVNRIYLCKFMKAFEQNNIRPSTPLYQQEEQKLSSLDEIEEILKVVMLKKSKEILNKINMACTKEKPLLTRKTFKQIIESMTFPIEDRLFDQLLQKYVSINPEDFVDCHEFLEKIMQCQCVNPFFTRVERGTETNGRFGNYYGEIIKPEDVDKVVKDLHVVTAQQLPHILAKKSQEKGNDITKGFLVFRKAGKDIVTYQALQNLLRKFDVAMNSEELIKIWNKCDPKQKGYITYEEFLEGCGLEELYKGSSDVGRIGYTLIWKLAGSENTTDKDVASRIPLGPNTESQTHEQLTQFKINLFLKEAIIKSSHDIIKALSDLDEQNTGQVPAEYIQNLLDAYGIRLPFNDWIQFLKPYYTGDREMVDIKSFINSVMCNDTEQPQSLKGQVTTRHLKETQDIIREVVSSKKEEFLDAFKAVDYASINAISKEDFRNILRRFSIDISQEMFSKLWSMLPVNDYGNLVYQDFMHWFDNPDNKLCSALRHSQSSNGPLKISTQRRPMTAPMTTFTKPAEMAVPLYKEEKKNAFWDNAEQILKDILSEKYEEVTNRIAIACGRGRTLLNCKALKWILDTVAFPVDDHHFDSLLERYATKQSKGMVNGQEFLEKMVSSGVGLGVITPSPPPPVTRELPGVIGETAKSCKDNYLLTAQLLPYVLAKKSQDPMQNVTKNFLTFRKAGKDIITQETLQNLLKHFNIGLSTSELIKLWKSCDPKNKNYITYEDFLKGCGLEELYKGNSEVGSTGYPLMWKTVPKKTENTDKSVVSMFPFRQENGHSTLVNKAQVNPSSNLMESIIDSHKNIWKDLLDLDVQKTGLLPVTKLVTLLEKYNIKLTNEQQKQIQNGSKNGSLNIKSVISHILYGPAELSKSHCPTPGGQTTLKSLKEMHDMVQEVVLAHKSDILTAFQNADYAFINTVCKEDFSNVLKKFGLNWDQETFSKFWSILPLNEYCNLVYRDFLYWYGTSGNRPSSAIRPPSSLPLSHTLEPWKPPGPNLLKDTPKTALSRIPFEVESMKFPAKVIRPVSMTLARNKIALATNHIYSPVVKTTLRLLVRCDLFIYKDLKNLKLALRLIEATKMKDPNGRPSTSPNLTLVNAEFAEKRIQDIIFNHWKLIQKQCRQVDTDYTGYINQKDFRDILEQYGKQIRDEEFTQLRNKYDLRGNGTIAYRDMIRYFLLDLKPAESLFTQRRILQETNAEKFNPGPFDDNLSNAMMRLRQCVTKHWRIMRRNFLNADLHRTGRINTADFRQILRNHNINLTEEEFYMIGTYYDNDFSGSINYNTFLKAFLKNW